MQLQLQRFVFPRATVAWNKIFFLTFLQKKADTELAKQREAEKAARSYDSLFSAEVDEDEDEAAPKKSVRELEEDFM